MSFIFNNKLIDNNLYESNIINNRIYYSNKKKEIPFDKNEISSIIIDNKDNNNNNINSTFIKSTSNNSKIVKRINFEEVTNNCASIDKCLQESNLSKHNKISKVHFRPSLISKNKEVNENTSIITSNTKLFNRNVLQLKIILLGDVSVGKTSIIKRLQYNEFNQFYNTTTSVDFAAVTFQIDNNGSKADVLVWDTCGSERFRSITKTYYNNINGVLLVYDICNKKTFENLCYWVDDLNNSIPKNNNNLITPVLIVGNKADDNNKREVSCVEAENWCRSNGFIYLEASAKSGYNVEYIFEELIQQIIIKIEDNTQIIETSKYYDKISLSTSKINNSLNCINKSPNLRRNVNKNCC